MNKKLFVLTVLLFVLETMCFSQQIVTDNTVTINGDKPRLVVLTDGEVDDRCSMVHFLLCSCDFEIDAIIETNSVFQPNGWSSNSWLEDEISDYAKVYPNLMVHNHDYPTPEYISSVCFVGDEDKSHLISMTPSATYPGETPKIDPALWPDTPGSDRLVDLLLDDDSRSVYILAWGGGNTAAKAFQKLKDNYPQDYQRAVSKAVMYNIWYQDGAGSYIESCHPLVTMLLSYNFSGTWDYGSLSYTEGFVNDCIRGTSPLASHYVQDYLSEGDSPSFFHFIANGLRSYENPTWGGWGGQFHKAEGFDRVYIDNGKSTYFMWTESVMRDFETRLKWACTDSTQMANHYPVVSTDCDLEIIVHSGEKVCLSANAVDNDPVDIDVLWKRYGPTMSAGGTDKETFAKMASVYASKPTSSWWQYREAGTYPGFVNIIRDASGVTFVAPRVSSEQTIHIIYEAKDWGKPALSSYLRFVITVLP